MYFPFHQDRQFRCQNTAFALLNIFADAVVIAVACYALSNLVLSVADSDIDVISFPYVAVFLSVFAVAVIVFITVYGKTKKGVVVTAEEITVTTGYFGKGCFFRTSIARADIASVTCPEVPRTETQKRNYRDYHYAWITVGVGLNAVPAVKITTQGEYPHALLFSCEEPEKLIAALHA